MPTIALSPATDVEGSRVGMFAALLLFVAAPVALALGVGLLATRFVPADEGGDVG